ncbi:family 78 glycoside hydrolase catalytic domain [Nakamurella lactea]|uniref:family 78 glycoside hydrolase catalytic domain n=1 Tax=Nakamurella lactea TaxID=459515 RepID=UPI001B7FB613|nr:family 78 glycoside hydrolase catalytic domain [Nakamurella lactea]
MLLLGLTAAGPAAAGPAATDPVWSANAQSVGHGSGALEVGTLSTNHLDRPLGTTTAAPTFGWQLDSNKRGTIQQSYRIQVATSEQALHRGAPDVWDSGAVASADSVAVRYSGPELQPQTRYYWRVRVTATSGATSPWSAATWWETALPAGDDWGASWVASPQAQIPGIDWTDYTATFVTSDISNGFGILLHSDASAANTYMWQLSNKDGIERLRPHVRVNGGWQLLAEVPIPAADLPGGFAARHSVSIGISGATVRTTIDGTVVDTRTVPAPIAAGTIGFRTCDCEDESGQLHEVTVTAGDTTLLHSDFADGKNPFGVGVLTAPGTIAFGHQGNEAIGLLVPKTGLPLLRKDFTVTKKVAGARLYATALGLYQAQINGHRVGDHELAPGWTDYDTRVQYQTYDVTRLLTAGPATIGVELAPGWYAGQIASFGTDKYGHWPAFRGKLVIDYTDGSSETVVSGSDWSWHDGPFRVADLINGETYDANYQVAGWSSPGIARTGWQPVEVVDGVPAANVQPQTDQPARVTGTQPTQKVSTPTPGVTIYDVGQNMVGRIKVTLSGTAGSTVRLRYGEMLNPDGTLYTANLRSAKVTDYYTFGKTGSATYQPTFTSHGFRYVEVTGAATPPTAQQLTGIVVTSDTPLTSEFDTSDPMLNQLQRNIVWGQRDNFLSVPTDTPARDERLGWTGDIDMFSPTASFNADTYAFLSKWLTDLRDAQRTDGSIPGVAPDPTHCCAGGPGWSDAMVGVPYTLWQHFGDTGVIDENYSAMARFVDFLTRTSSGDLRTEQVYGDWLNLDDPTPAGVIASAFYARSVGQLAEMAAATGHAADAARYQQLAARIRSAFAAAFVGPDGTVAGNSQAGYAIALGMGLVPADLQQAAGNQLVAAVAARGYHLSTGFLGTPFLLPALTATGHLDVAYRLMMTKDYPSWLYEVSKGATTMWERWDSLKPDGTFGDVSMNSFNHYAYGAVGEWMYATIGGIRQTSAGYRTSTIAPQLGGGLTSARVAHDSPYGTISSSWQTGKGSLELTVTVPANTTTTVLVPAPDAAAVTEGHRRITGRADLKIGQVADGVVPVQVGSGSYRFVVATPVALTELSAPQDIQPGDAVEVTASLANSGRRSAAVTIRLGGPDGWVAAAPIEVTVPARGTVSVPLTITAPVTIADGDVPFTATVTGADGGRIAAVDATGAVAIDTPPAAAMDTVSFGVPDSETAHQVTGSPSSGTNTEAGVPRRYSHNGYPGSWFETTMKVTPDKPFVIAVLETFSGDGSAATKDYDVIVDGSIVQHFVLTRFGTDPGTLVHQVLVPASRAAASGTVRIRFQYNSSGRGYDPSLSKAWTVPVG